MSVKFLFITANLKEKEAFENSFKAKKTEFVKGKRYKIGKFGRYDVAYIHIDSQGVTSPAAMPIAGELIRKINPIGVVMVGIAFGADKKSQNIGDVLVSEKILSYDYEKIDEHDSVYPETVKEVGFQFFNAFSDDEDWVHYTNKTDRSKVFTGVMLTGSKRINNQGFKDKLLIDFEKYSPIGGEMEAYGVYSSCRMHGVQEWIIVKGICDWAYDKSQDKDKNQEIAAKAAVSFCHHVFSRPVFNDLTKAASTHSTITRRPKTQSSSPVCGTEVVQEGKPPNTTKSQESVYLIFTDVVDSSAMDNDSSAKQWRNQVFCHQLEHLLKPQNAIALKSIGDSLFIVIKELGAAKILDIFKYLCDALNNFKIEDKSVEIRAIMHKIDMATHTHGQTIADHINATIKDKDLLGKSEHLRKTLERDVFGIEVNKANRILSLLTGAAVLLTKEVVEAYCVDKSKYDAFLKKKHNEIENGMSIHSPFPIISLKSFNEVKIETPLIVWHLSKTTSTHTTLTQEYKKKHSIRLLTAVTKNPVTTLTQMKDCRKNVICKLRSDDLTKAFSFDFYTDFFWDLVDYVDLTSMDFSREHTNRTLKYHDLYLPKYKNIARASEETQRKEAKEAHHFYKYDVTFEITKHDTAPKFAGFTMDRNAEHRQKEAGNTSLITSLVIDSFSDKCNSQSNRQLYDFKGNETEKDIEAIIPQSIDIYQNIDINGDVEFCSGKFKKESSRFLLVFFRYFMDNVDEAERTYKNLFKDNVNCPASDSGITLNPLMKGHITGLIDAFVIFEIHDTQNREQHTPFKIATYNFLNYAINIAPNAGKTFYKNCYPTSVFFLKKNETFDIDERNLAHLITNSRIT